MSDLHFTLYTSLDSLPASWDTVAHDNAFLQTPYLRVLEESAPTNMQCFFIGIYEKETLIGVALAQYLDISKLYSFGERQHCIKTKVRNFAFRRLARHVLFIGNTMITGQNGYTFVKPLAPEDLSSLLRDMADELMAHFKKQGTRIHLVSFKDFYTEESQALGSSGFRSLFHFSVQPNMIFRLLPSWQNRQDYVADLQKKYRDQYKRAQKKGTGITYYEMDLPMIQTYEEEMYALYHHVALNAPFNTFFLAKNHFYVFKKQCGDRFKVFGYFLGDKLIGFHTLLLNGQTLETYFLGYDAAHQKERMLYLNMLYRMTAFGIENQFQRIIFGRTALEIKSSIGAEPIPMFGFMRHTQPLVQKVLPRLFENLEPPTRWEQRHPFKNRQD
ncbi:GNAT family N-acetyltransferase [Flavobacterium sp.]|uniref:GNAT family N-acetyltransferase n=1 Tax=Flavobacterium sp. TaxID=239 RepID=UPI0026223CF4|nr:GNAT family N-acetyltransferase [Flavobacterium sp.]